MSRCAKRLTAAIGLTVLLTAAPAPAQNPADASDFGRGRSRGPTVPAASSPADRYAPRGDVGGRFPPDTPAARRPATRPVDTGSSSRFSATYPAEPRYAPPGGQPRQNGSPAVIPAGHATTHSSPPAGSTFPARKPATGLRISRDGDSSSGSSGESPGRRSSAGGLWTSFASLAALVLVLVGGARLWKKHGPQHATAVPTEAVEILGRRPLDVRHSVVLVRLGSRILVLGSGPGGLQTLTELSDPVEVDFLAGQCRRQDSESAVAQTFRSLFQLESGKAARDRQASSSPAVTAATAAGSPYGSAERTFPEPQPAVPRDPASGPHASAQQSVSQHATEEQPAPADDWAYHPADYTVYREQPVTIEGAPATASESINDAGEPVQGELASGEWPPGESDRTAGGDEQRRKDTAAILERLRMHSGGTTGGNTSDRSHPPRRSTDAPAAESEYDAAG